LIFGDCGFEIIGFNFNESDFLILSGWWVNVGKMGPNHNILSFESNSYTIAPQLRIGK